MADDSTILSYIIQAQDQARGLLEQQVQVLTKMSAGIDQVVAATRRQVGVAQQSTTATAKQADGMMRLLRTQTELENSNKRTLAAFNAVSTSITSGNQTWAARVGMVKQLDAAVQKNSTFMTRYGQQWTELTNKLKAAGPVSQQTIAQLNQGAMTFGSVAKEQKSPVAFGQAQAAQTAQQTAQQAREQAKAAAEAARAAQQQGNALDGLVRQQQAVSASNQRLVQGFGAVNQILGQGGTISKQTAAGLQVLNTSMQANSAFMQKYGQQWNTLISQMQAGAQITPQMAKQFNQLGSAFQQTTGQSGQTVNALQGIQGAAMAVQFAVGALATKIGHELVQELQRSIQEAGRFQSTFIGLASISKAFGQDIGEVNAAARELASDGLISVKDSAIALRNLMMTGFNLEQAVNLAKGFKDIASFNRQASLELGYAITSATEGIKNQNSLLVDNAGLTKNLTIILKELGLSEQDLAKASSNATVRMALYNGLLKEMAPMQGDAARLADTFQGSQARLTVQTQLLRVAIGEQLMPAVQSFNDVVSKTFEFFRNNDSVFGDTARFLAVLVTVTLAVGVAFVAMLGLVGSAVTAYTLLSPAILAAATSMGVLNASMAGIALSFGAIAVGIGIVVAGLVVFGNRSKQAAQEIQALIDKTTQQQSALEETKKKLEALSGSEVTAAERSAGLREEYVKLAGILPNLKTSFAGVEDALRFVNAEFTKGQEILSKYNLDLVEQQLSQFGASAFEQGTALDRLRKKIKELDAERTKLAAGPQSLNIRGEISYLRDLSVVYQKQALSLHALLARRQQIIAQQKETSQGTQAEREAQRKATENLKIFIDVTKGQISTQEDYAIAIDSLKLKLELLQYGGITAAESQALIAQGGEIARKEMERLELKAVTLAEAYRILEKDAKGAFDSARMGVGVMDEDVAAIIRHRDASARQLRLQQEAEQRSELFANKTRALTYAIIDQTVGIDSSSKVWQLLTNAMQKNGLEFNAGLMRIPALAGLVKDLSDRVGLSAQQYDLLAKAQRAAFEEQNRVSVGTVKLRAETEDFRNALFEQTAGTQSSEGAWTLLQMALAETSDQTLTLQQRSDLLKSKLEAVTKATDVGSERWKDATAALLAMNTELARQEFLIGLLAAGDGAEAAADGILSALQGVQDKVTALGGSLSLPQIKFAQNALEALVAGGLLPTGTTLDQVNAKLTELGVRLTDPKVRADALKQTLIDYSREISVLAGDAEAKNAELAAKWAMALAIQDEAVRDNQMRALLPDIEALVEQGLIGADAWREWGAVLAYFGKGPLEDIRQRQQAVATANVEFQRNLVKFGRTTAEQQIRDATLAADEQVRVLTEAKGKIEKDLANKPLLWRLALTPITTQEIDAINRKIASEVAQSALSILEGKPEFNDFVIELRNLLTDIGQASGKELDALVNKLKTADARIKSILLINAKWRDQVKETNRRLAETVSFLQSISSIIAAIDPDSDWLDAAKFIQQAKEAGAAATNFKDTISAIRARLKEDQNEKIRFSDIVDLAGFGAEIVTSMIAAIKGVGQMKQGIAKAFAASEIGAEIGEVIGEGIGLMIGAPKLGAQIGKWGGRIIGFITGMFHKANWERIGQEVAQRFGGGVSDELAKQIDALSKTLEGGTKNQRNQRAQLLSMSAILEEQGGITAKNIQAYTTQSKGLYEEIARGGKNAKVALEQLNSVFENMVTFMDAELNGMVNPAMLEFIQNARQSGVEVKAVTEFLKKMADAALDAMNAVTGAFTGRFTQANDFIAKIEDMTQKRRELAEAIAKEDQGSAKWNKLTKELRELDAEFERVKKQALGLSGMLADTATNSQERFDRLGRLLGTTFDAAIASGKTFADALLALRPSLEGMRKTAEEAGYSISESLQNLIDLSDWAASNQQLATGISGLNTLMKSLANQGAVTQGVFNDFGNEAAAQFQDIINSGQSSDNALRLMQPTLQTLWEMQKRFGYVTDETTQKLLAEAVASGAVGAQHQTASERMVDGINKVVDRLDILLNRMFGIPIAAASAAGGVGTAGAGMVGSVAAVGDEADRTARRLYLMGQAGVDAAHDMYDANSGVIYGNSPGGLTDLNDHLNTAINNYYVLGQAAVEASENMTEAMSRYLDVLHNIDDLITEATLEGSELAMFRLMKDKAKMIEQFMKDIEGASEDIIQSGLEKIDRLFDIRASKVADQGRTVRQETAKIQRDFALSAKLFEQTLNFMHNGLQRSVTMKGLLPTATAFTPQPLATTATPTMSIPLSGFAEGVMASPQEPRVGVFGEKKPEIGGTVDFMKEALVGALKEAGMDQLGGSTGDMVFDFRGANIPDEEGFKKMIEKVGVQHLMTLQRRNFRGYRSAMVRSTQPTRIKVRNAK